MQVVDRLIVGSLESRPRPRKITFDGLRTSAEAGSSAGEIWQGNCIAFHRSRVKTPPPSEV